MYVKDSFIVKDRLKLAIVDKRITPSIEDKLKSKNIELIKTIACNNTYNAIKYHPDILLCKLNDNNIVVAPNVYDYFKDKLDKYNFNTIKGSSTIENKYPYNIAYNIVLFGKFAIHNFKYTDNKILDFIDRNNFIKIHVSQGYTKCSVCIVDENSIITSDKGIHIQALKYNIDSLLIQSGFIDLFDLNYGFIGGCSGLISNDELAFYGSISSHPDSDKIIKFVNSKNKRVINLSDDKLLDLGSIIPLMY